MCIIALILLLQWHQTYSVLSNPTRAIVTLFRNWAQKIQIIIIVFMTLLLLFDLSMIIGDSKTGV